MKLFEVGKTYETKLINSSNSTISVTVTARTAKTITDQNGKRFGVIKRLSAYNNAETIRPLGNYSMCPIVRADRGL